MTEPGTEIRVNVIDEARRVLDRAAEARVPLRLIGGLAIRLRLPEVPAPAFVRNYQDLDLVTLKGEGRRVTELLQADGYESDEVFNATNGHRRLLFRDAANRRQVDVFVGTFAMCHTVPITARFEISTDTIPLAELLLTKLQIVELNPKDRADIATLVFHHDVGETDGEIVNAGYIATLCAADWGLWRTVRMNVERTLAGLESTPLAPGQRDVVHDRLGLLWERIEAEPKPRKWRLRNRVGDRVCWYEEPEEVGG